MGVLSSVLLRGSPENPNNPITDVFRGADTYTGEPLSTIGAMNYSAVRACQRVLAESVASLPCLLYQRIQGGKERASKHPLFGVLHENVNPEITAFTFWELAMTHLTGWGNFYAEILKNASGEVVEMWPLNPERTTLRRGTNGSRYYEVQLGDGRTVNLEREKVFHVIGVSLDGITGVSMLSAHKNAVAIGLALEKFTGKYFANDAMPGGILEHPAKLTTEAHSRLRSSWEAVHAGLDNKHRVAILEEGMKLHEIGINIEDSQLLPLKRFQLEEVSRLFRVPLHLVNDLERATYNNIDVLDIGFVKHSLRPWLVRFEQAIKLQLMNPAERKVYFAEFLVDAMERGDPDKRANLYSQLRQNGILNGNEIRSKENLNHVDELDAYWQPGNMLVAGQAVTLPQEPRSAPKQIETRSAIPRLSASFRSSLKAVVERILRAEEREITKALKSAAGEDYRAQLQRFLDGYYTDSIDFVLRQLALVLEPFGDVVAQEAASQVGKDTPDSSRFVDRYTQAAAERYTGYSREALSGIVSGTENEADIEGAILGRLDSWKTTRAESVAKEETVRMAGAITKFVFLAAGVTLLRWHTNGDNCPACTNLNGMVVGVEESFVPQGQSLDMGAGNAPIKLGRSIGHPPLHNGCDCFIGPG